MLKVIYGENQEVLNKLAKENGVAYSESDGALLTTNKILNSLKKKYNLIIDDENICITSLSEYISMGSGEEILIFKSIYSCFPDISIPLYDCIDIVEDRHLSVETSVDVQNNINRLINSRDWYEELFEFSQEMMRKEFKEDVNRDFYNNLK